MSEEIKNVLREVLKEEFAEFRRTTMELQNDLAELRVEASDRMEKLEHILGNLDQRIGTMEKKDEKMADCLEKIEHDYERKDKKISSIIVQYQHLESFIGTEIKRLTAIHDKQKTIDLLAARSIQHEADINELNRVVKNH
ncbi:hypothetical protein [Bacillus sp. 1NLA3E]|uniref:hypothetical protein n=1 Tax=Bacillus sp. 1NLA3E TaxID=666686 RepID=UPI000247F355|nr:hypothetical protein [Bacillus sp. 1NLA3E]AGK53814.1 hypothetical protein B1NLA3E_10280 [Bacillus sp. 1NLA3E]